MSLCFQTSNLIKVVQNLHSKEGQAANLHIMRLYKKKALTEIQP